MSFGDHLEELRKRLLIGLAAPLPLFVVIFFFSDTLIGWLLRPVYAVLQYHDLPPTLQVLGPPEYLLAKLKLSIIFALVITAPWLIYQLWKFIAPGLYGHERRFVYFLLPGSGILTVAGIALLYYVMLPLMLHVLVMFAADADLGVDVKPLDPRIEAVLAAPPPVEILTAPPLEPEAGMLWLLVPALELQVAVLDEEAAEEGAIEKEAVEVLTIPRPSDGGVEQAFRVGSVIDFTLVLMLGVSIAFQMPLVILLLGWMGLVTVPWLRSKRRYALAICGITSAIITPADAISMIIMLIPLYGLYELGILLLQIAPAGAVRRGRIAGIPIARPKTDEKPRGRGAAPDNETARAEQPTKPAQPDSSIPRAAPGTHPRSDAADEEGDG